MHAIDSKWMQRALELAERGRGHVEPNPLVGAVLVRDDQVVGEGWHERYGQAHAEVNALTAAGAAARGAALYVTLEPCCHHGKTPPCTDAIQRSGVVQVVAAMLDPFPEVASRGAGLLREAGIVVDVGMCEREARRLNAPYLKLVTTGRPYVHAKWAMTLDGKIVARTGDSRWISNEASRQRVHELRGRVDAIIVGIGTVLADDPLLTARPPGPRIATRVVLDTQGRLPAESRLVRTMGEAPLLQVTGGARGVSEVLVLPLDGGRVSVSALLDELGQRRMTNVMVEGGTEVLGSFFDAGAVDEVWVFVAPKIVGGKGVVGGRGVDRMAAALQVREWSAEMVEGDIMLHGLMNIS
jgi:diaminohydroxyphosphoribosylaminopyrimidine deaminase/5-amino-6-(5-phosphoribosylamino)uracil reductase